MISKEDIKQIARIAKLRLSEEELDKMEKKLNQSLASIKVLEEVDTNDVEPLYHVLEDREIFREDEVIESNLLTRDEALKNTKEKQYGYFKLLNIMD